LTFYVNLYILFGIQLFPAIQCRKFFLFFVRKEDGGQAMSTKRQKFVIFFVLALLLVALPTTTVLANKQAWKASISSANELHEVVGSTAKGTANFGTNPNGSIHFIVSVRGLSGTPTGAHLHAPASTSEDAGVVVTLCGSGPGTAVLGACSLTDGVFIIEGDIMGYNLNGMSAKDFFNALDDGMVYFNVHTAANPSGEARGQLVPR
jgi:hypothetical protein